MLFVVIGLVSGGLYALLGLGLVVVFRSSGVINFAHGGVALVAAYVYFDLRAHNSPSWSAVLIAVVAAGLLNLAIFAVVIQPLRAASALTKAIATLAVLVILQAAISLRYGSSPQIPPAFLPQHRFHLLGAAVTTANLLIVLISIVLVAGLGAVYRRTKFGVATSAVAENELAFAILGHSTKRIAAANWAIGGVLAGIAGVLIGPVVEITPAQATSLLIPALAVGLFGRFRSFPVALVGGLVIGLGQSEVVSHSSTGPLSHLPGLSEALPFIVIIVVLTIRGDSLPARDFVAAALPRVGTGLLRPFAISVWGALALLAVWTLPVEWVAAVTTSLIAATLLLSLVVLTGFAGQLSLAQVSIGAVAVVVASWLTADFGWPMVLSGLVGVAASLPIALLIGLPALRTRGVTLAVVTLGLADAFNAMLFSRNDVNRSGSGFTVGNARLFGLDINEGEFPRRYACFALLVIVAVALSVANLRRSSTGKTLIAVRGNERAAAALGISVRNAKLFAFMVSGVIASAAGLMSAWRQPIVVPSGLADPFQSVNAAVAATFGGVGFIPGAIVGGTATQPGSVGGTFIDKIGLGQWLTIIAGALLLINVVLNPNGVVPDTLAAIKQMGRRLHASGFGAGRMPSVLDRSSGSRVDTASAILRTADEKAVGTRDRAEPAELLVRNLSVTFGVTRAVANVDVRCVGGEVVGVIGPNGSGKTTFIDAVTGYVDAEGEILFNGRPMQGLSAFRRARLGVSRSFQSLELFEDLTVAENLLAAAGTGRWHQWFSCLVSPSRPKVNAAVSAAVREFDLVDVLDRLPSELPYGKRRLLAICRALGSSPRVLFLDEPAAGLGEADRAELRRVIRRLADYWGLAVVLIEHDVDLVMDVSDRVIAFEFGKKIADGAPSDVRRDPNVVRSYLGSQEETEPTTYVSATGQIAVGAPGGRSTALAVSTLSAGYGDAAVVSGLDLHVDSGEIVALLGANGAGKTTTLLAVSGVIRPTGGEVRIDGHVTREPIHRRACKGLAFLPQQGAVFRELSVRDNLRLGLGSTSDALELFPELADRLAVRAGLLSGGEQQMLALARLLASRPAVILADELSLGLAPLAVRRLWDALTEAATRGTAVLVVEQYARAALSWSSRGYVLGRGELQMEGTSRELLSRIDDLATLYL